MTAAATETETEHSHLWSDPDTMCPGGEPRDRALLKALVQLLEDTRAPLSGVVFGRDGLYLTHAGMDQVQVKRATTSLKGLHLVPVNT